MDRKPYLGGNCIGDADDKFEESSSSRKLLQILQLCWPHLKRKSLEDINVCNACMFKLQSLQVLQEDIDLRDIPRDIEDLDELLRYCRGTVQIKRGFSSNLSISSNSENDINSKKQPMKKKFKTTFSDNGRESSNNNSQQTFSTYHKQRTRKKNTTKKDNCNVLRNRLRKRKK